MAYFPDLSPYAYLQTQDHVLNIGWLDEGEPFPTGKADIKALEKLGALLPFKVWQSRGGHDCPFCGARPLNTDGTPVATAEIRVFAEDGTAYAAPTMLLHYMEDHDYAPPQEFIEALMATELPPTEAYFQDLLRIGMDAWEHKQLRKHIHEDNLSHPVSRIAKPNDSR